jgi:steroid delta-isomerase-like uncharacterized protein
LSKEVANPLEKAEGKGGEFMSEENKALSRRAIEEIFNAGNLDVADEIVAPDHIHHDPAMPEEGHGIDHFKQFATMYRTAFPDVHIEIEDQIAEGDKVAYRWVGKGTHEGDLMGIAPTGNRVTVAGITIDRIADGKIAETWENYDAMGMMQQLGALPAQEGQQPPEQTEEGQEEGQEEEKGLIDKLKDKLRGQ